MRYQLCIDIGGTTSKLLCLDDNEQHVYTQQKKGISEVASSPLQAAERIGAFIDEVTLHLNGEAPHTVGCGIGGAGRDHIKSEIKTALTQKFTNIRFYITDDINAAYAGAFGRNDGIIVMAGTGSAFAGRLNGTWYRSGGYGYLLGDEGSGREIGRKGLRIAARQMDAGKTGTLLELVQEQFQIFNRNDLINTLYGKELPLARFAQHVLKAAGKGNQNAKTIVNKEIQLLLETLAIVINSFPSSKQVLCLHGSLFLSEYYNRTVRQCLTEQYPGIQFKEAQESPAKGVFLLMNNKF